MGKSLKMWRGSRPNVGQVQAKTKTEKRGQREQEQGQNVQRAGVRSKLWASCVQNCV
ncbi:hypothetical protein [Helicobacter sp. 11S02596-1]|uniref:hypothetical protein n=1 Tax=Helicobacter sp. 11S02596-1 TaxID=1476194 RepID=UPI0015DED394|nr:hypothetical protein [Helicobacter sp. 11S02596-1]